MMAISMPVGVGKSYIPQKKPYNPLFESNFETGQIFVKKGYIPVLVKVVLLHSRGCGHPQDDAMPDFFLGFKGGIICFRNLLESKNILLKSCCTKIYTCPLVYHSLFIFKCNLAG